MCGIFGIYQTDGKPVDLTIVQRSTTSLRHRGPDDEGYLLVNTSTGETILCGGDDTIPDLRLPHIETLYGKPFDLVFGFRRLSILDLSPAGHQPMCSHDGRCWIVFNGEIYNYLELRTELAGYGYTFHSGTDTEVFLASYQHWGDECLTRFTGMWACALWDSTTQRLFLSRDRFGIKPLYYLNDGDTFAFASEIKALLCLPTVNRRANPQRVFDYLRYGLTDHGGQTLFQAIQQVPLAHTLDVPIGNIHQARNNQYWDIALNNQSLISCDQAAATVQTIFLDNIRLHLRSDVPVGAALSGGIDSSSIVMAMRHLQGPSLDIHTFSYIAEEATINEEPWVDMIGQAAGTTAHKIRANPDELVADLDHLIAIQDEPFGSTSIYAQHRVFRQAHEAGIKVMLDGQGADELLAGYYSYHAARLASLLRQKKWNEAMTFVRAVGRLPGNIGIRMLLKIAGGMLVPPFLKMSVRKFGGREHVPAWMNTSWFDQHDVLVRRLPMVYGRDVLRSCLHQTFVETSLPMLLRYEDRNSMAYSIESRVPFLTAHLVQFVFSLSEECIIAMDATTKAVLRHAMRNIVPNAILNRRDKIGFNTPEQQWLFVVRPWVEEVFSGQTAQHIPVLNIPEIQQKWQLLIQGKVCFDSSFWRWINVIRWVEQQRIEFA